MRIYRDLEELPELSSSVVTLGSFDGVHLAHQALLRRVKERSLESGAEGFVVTFEPHPRVVLGKAEGLKLLTTTEEKIELLERYGVENLLILPFTRELSAMDYTTFIRTVLLDKLAMREMVVGFNHRVGRDGGNHSAIESMGEDFAVSIVERIESQSGKISSTLIRKKIEAGLMSEAVELLAHPYLIHVKDINSFLTVEDSLKLLPKEGVRRTENIELRVIN